MRIKDAKSSIASHEPCFFNLALGRRHAVKGVAVLMDISARQPSFAQDGCQRHQPRIGLAGLGQDDFLSRMRPFQQLGKVCLCLRGHAENL